MFRGACARLECTYSSEDPGKHLLDLIPWSHARQALRLLPSNLAFPLSDVILTPYMPVPETNGEEWDRLEPAAALDVLVELALHGEYNGLYGNRRLKDDLELRGAALNIFGVSPPSRSLPRRFKHPQELCSQRGDQASDHSRHAPSRRCAPVPVHSTGSSYQPSLQPQHQLR